MSEELNTVMTDEINDIFIKDSYNFSLEKLAGYAMVGLLSNGNEPSYDLAHKAYKMAEMMMHIKEGYMKKI
jgi:hypothetical protein